MLISDYEKKTRLDPNDDLVIETPDGPFGITGQDLADSVKEMTKDPDPEPKHIPLWQKKLIVRGQNITGPGIPVTERQRQAIANGTFDDIFLGDYWEVPLYTTQPYDIRRFTVVDFDYWYGIDYNSENLPKVEKHHVVLMAEYLNGMQVRYDSAYADSILRTSYLPDLTSGADTISKIYMLTGEGSDTDKYLLNYPEYLSALDEDGTVIYKLRNCTVELPTIGQIMGDGSYNLGEFYYPHNQIQRQFSLYRQNPAARVWIRAGYGSVVAEPYHVRDIIKRSGTTSDSPSSFSTLQLNGLYAPLTVSASIMNGKPALLRYMFGMTGE